ncbi:MAG: divalent-cation tolerance protein CutA [Amphiplicatus sp.]
MNICLLYVTAPDEKTAASIAEALIEARLAACVNITNAMTSLYRWKGAVEQAREAVLIAKTTKEAAPKARDLILGLHPYETPCVLAFDISPDASNNAFLDWIAAETKNNFRL